jgi:hypothetical protein
MHDVAVLGADGGPALGTPDFLALVRCVDVRACFDNIRIALCLDDEIVVIPRLSTVLAEKHHGTPAHFRSRARHYQRTSAIRANSESVQDPYNIPEPCAIDTTRGERGTENIMARKKLPSDATLRQLREFGLAYPGAHTKSPWPGHLDLAVNDKTFAYLSLEGEPLSISCKLPRSCLFALGLPFTKPTAHGLGKSGWVSATFASGQKIPVALLKE